MTDVRLADVAEFVLDGTHGSPVRTESGVPVLSAQNVRGGRLLFETDRQTTTAEYDAFRRRLPLAVGDVLLTIVGTIGRAAVVEELRPLVFQRSVAVIRPLHARLSPRFLFHVTQSSEFQAQLARSSNKSSQAGVYLGKLKELRIPLPPLAEQRRIVDVLDRAEALRAKRRAALAQLDTLTQSIFLEMFGDPSKNPQRWPQKTIGELAEVKGGKRLPKGEEYSLTPTLFRYVRVTDLRGGAVDESALVYLKPEVQAKIARYIVRTGDVIISIAGSIGLIAPVPPSLDGANLTENAAKLVPRGPGVYDSGYLATVLQMPATQSQIASHIGQVTIGKLALFRIEKMTVPLPPIALQEDFVRRLDQVAVLKSETLGSLAEFDALFASLQHRAFRGEL